MNFDKVAVAKALPLTYARAAEAQPILADDLDSTVPAELRSWLDATARRLGPGRGVLGRR